MYISGPHLKSINSYFIKGGPRLRMMLTGPSSYRQKGGPTPQTHQSIYNVKRGPRLKGIKLYFIKGAHALKSSTYDVKGPTP
jgi:hypothetical protein